MPSESVAKTGKKLGRPLMRPRSILKGKQSTLIPGDTCDTERVGFWLTPPDLMAELQEEFAFDFDACPFPRPAGFNGLVESWGANTYVNPPFGGGLGDWIRKALKEQARGCRVVLITPSARLDRLNDILEDVEAKPEVRHLWKNVAWLNPQLKKTSRPQACALVIFGA